MTAPQIIKSKPKRARAKCLECGRQFWACRPWHRYCSNVCRTAVSNRERLAAVKEVRRLHLDAERKLGQDAEAKDAETKRPTFGFYGTQEELEKATGIKTS